MGLPIMAGLLWKLKLGLILVIEFYKILMWEVWRGEEVGSDKGPQKVLETGHPREGTCHTKRAPPHTQ